jgi:hypothetical protein
MLRNILKVHGEDLANGDLAVSSISGGTPVCAGGTSGALVVNVFAKGDVVLSDDVNVSVKHGDTIEGGFSEVFVINLDAGSQFRDGELMATSTLSENTKTYIVADVTSSQANSGGIRVTLGYLAR